MALIFTEDSSNKGKDYVTNKKIPHRLEIPRYSQKYPCGLDLYVAPSNKVYL